MIDQFYKKMSHLWRKSEILVSQNRMQKLVLASQTILETERSSNIRRPSKL